MTDPIANYVRKLPPEDPESANNHLDGELRSLERSTRALNTSLASLTATAAPIDSPAFTGTPTAPTPSASDDSTSLATTAWVQDELDGMSVALTGNVTGSGSFTTRALSFATTLAASVVAWSHLASSIVASASEYAAATASKLLSASNVWSAAAFNSLTDGATITPDFNDGWNFSVTLGGNRTLANPSNIKVGQAGQIKITQDGTGSRTLAYGTYWKFPNGTSPTLSTAASSVDLLSYVVVSSTEIYASLTKAYA